MSSLKRAAIVLLAMTLLVSMAAGCARKAEEAKPAEQKPAEQAPPAQAPKPEPPKKLKVGLVFDVGGRGDKSFNDMAYAGLEKAEKEFADKIETKYLEPSAGGENREQLLRLLAEDKYDLILGIGFLFTDHVAKVAGEYPNVKFGLVDGFIADLKADSNVRCLLFQEQEGSFLVGAAAALKTKTNKIGFVGGMKIPLIEKFEAGYLAGAKYANPKVTWKSEYIGTTGDAFKDPVRGQELTNAQLNWGADVVYHASGASGIGVIEAAASKKKFAIGVDADQTLTAKPEQQPYVLTSMLKRVDVAVYDTISLLVNGKFEGGYKIFGLADDGVGYAVNDINKELIKDIEPKLEEIKKKIIAGEIKVPFDKPTLDEFLKNLK
ncbi:MAG: BMP family ABC transporter substrate-binding protein [Firmicutes bacterium]|jgi:basic membrane protein A|nr:BMP family ABC transporter substrate-binding protein [Bacillota bacterium]